MTEAYRRISIHRFGEPGGVSLDSLAEEISAAFRMDVSVGRGLPVPAGALDPRRKQYRSSLFLEALKELRREGNAGASPEDILLGLTGEDLFVPSLNFVFGEADADSGVAVVSLHRLRPEFYGRGPDPALLKQRATKESVHELGHVFGLPHCDNPFCIMHFSNSIADSDLKGPGFCEKCQAKLAAAGIGHGEKD